MKDENQSQQAGDNSINVQGKTVVVHQGMSLEQLDEVKSYIDNQMTKQFRENFISLTGQAQVDAEQRARDLLEEFIDRLASEAPENITTVNSVSMQNAIYNAQKTAAITGDTDLADTLVDILVDKSGTEPQSFKGVVLSEALEVAGKLTTDQINALTVIVMLSRTLKFGWRSPELAVDGFAYQCEPFYNLIPKNNSAFQYMAYTGVGATTFGNSYYAQLAKSYNGSFSKGFTKSQIPESLYPFLESDCFVLSHEDGDNSVYKPGVATSQSLEDQLNMQHPIAEFATDYRTLIEGYQLEDSEVESFIRSRNSELAEFIDRLQGLGANAFVLSTVGIAIGQANWRRVQPSTAPDIDIYLN